MKKTIEAMKHLPQAFSNWEQQRIERELNFLRPIVNGYETYIEQIEKQTYIKHTKLCILPVKCNYAGNSLFLQPAVKVKITDFIWDFETETRYYSPKSFMYLSLLL